MLSFAVSCVVFWNLLTWPRGSRVLVDNLYTWIGAGVGDTVVSADIQPIIPNMEKTRFEELLKIEESTISGRSNPTRSST